MLPLNFLLYTAVSGNFLLWSFLGVVDFSGASDFAYNPLLSATLPLETQTVAAADSTGVRVKTPWFLFIPGCQMLTSKPLPRFQFYWGVLLKLNLWIALA